ncbi:MAG TPA: hypothetical protein VH437_17010 [Terriglobales bacterium]|jgi:hypothetical protein
MPITPDPAEQLQRLYVAGFELETFERFPKCVGVVRDQCIAMLVPGVGGMQILGTPGWRMGDAIGVLVEKGGRQVFQAKQEIVEATPERLQTLEKFRHDLGAILKDNPE